MSQEKANQLEPQLTLKNHNPGCMWGILHHFQHNRWHNVVKRLPRRRLIGHAKHPSPTALPDPNSAKTRENSDDSSIGSPNAEARAIVPKSSMKSRIKALITDDKRRKGWHKRNSTYPIKKPADGPVQPPEKTEPPPLPLPQSTSGDDPCSASLCHRDHNVGPEASCDLCDTMVKVNYLKQNELGKQPIRDHTLLHGNSIYAVEPSKLDAIQESKLFMDALDLLNVREEVFLKILQDPTSSLANNQLQFRQPRLGLNKCVSFAATSEKRDLAAEEDPKQDEGENGDADEVFVKKTAGILGFKNIGARIRHVIRDKKKEKNRIIKDAVHDKIPCDRHVCKNEGQIVTDFGQLSKKSFKRTTSFSDSFDRYNQLLEISIDKDAKDHVSDRLRFKAADKQAPHRASPAKLGRIFSLPDLRSYSSTHIDDSSSYSSPVALDKVVVYEQKPVDLGSCSEKQENLLDVGDDFDELVILKSSETDSSSVLNIEHVLVSAPPLSNLGEMSEDDEFVHEIEVCEDSKNSSPIQQDLSCSEQDIIDIDTQESEMEQIQQDLSSSEQDMIDINTQESEMEQIQQDLSCSEQDIIDINTQESEMEQIQQDLSCSEQDMIDINTQESEMEQIQQDLSCSEQDMIDINTQESEIEQFYNDLMHMHKVDTKNLAEYNYVRDVLELSGFSRDAFLGKWQSSDHVLNPSLFKQVEGCLVDDSESEHFYANNDHALLFDMINEVLLGIHERSFCYWPRSLTKLSRLHRLPKGNRVLEEVWTKIRWLLSWSPEGDQAIDDAVSRDMSKDDGWMNLQLDSECVGMKLEDMIYDDLVDEIIAE